MKGTYYAVALFGFAALVAAAAYGFASLPETIPSRFDLSGHVSDWAPKATLWILPGTMAFTLAVCYLVTGDGNATLRLPFDVPPAKMEMARSMMRDMTALLAAVLSAGFFLIEVADVESARMSAASPLLMPAIALSVGGALAAAVGYTAAVYRATQTG